MENNAKSLEELIHRELSSLPERTAPQTLIPRVLAQIEARARKRWWQRPWTDWPCPLQVISFPFMLASALGTVVGVSLLGQWLLTQLSAVPVSRAIILMSAAWDILNALGGALVVLGRAAFQPWMLAGLVVAAAMYAACLGLGTLCYRVAVTRASHE